ncbi:hypothetical protein Pan216_14520 [Planctomycetes bacterium Pan216]|uniref:Uncharacterized protein n=1 Tax=Kolteria novifilia TaxID=2527975 RepID=A0A518B0W7_9BACT|nr:hypothetical protein Pan216_14520 [Planctomycetes bacterium Pan216]
MKEFFIKYGEKLALGVVALLAIWCFYGAVTKEPYERIPQDFANATDRAEKNVENSPVTVDEDMVAPDFNELVATTTKPIDGSQYQYATRWMRPFDFGQNFRGEPALYPPEAVQVRANRGSIHLFDTDENGKRLTKRVKAEDAQGFVKEDEEQMAALARAGRMVGGMAGMEASPEMAMGGGFLESMQQMSMYDSGMMGQYSDMMGYGSEYPGMLPEEMGMMPSAPQRAPQTLIGGGQRRTIVTQDMLEKKKETKKTDPRTRRRRSAKEEEKEDFVEVYVDGLRGKRWVEILAEYPHQEQIKEYVKALREGAQEVGLRYALAEVERSELGPDYKWGPFKPIDVEAQLEVSKNAVAYLPETFPQVVMKGLAMNLPWVTSSFMPHLTSEAFENPEMAEYTPEELDPLSAELKKREDVAGGRFSRGKAKVPQGMMGRPGMMPEEDMVGSRPMRQPLGRGGRPAGPGFGNPGFGSRGQRGMEGMPPEGMAEMEIFDNRSEVEKAMIRFWDFTVQPGGRYKYRIRVKALNPNLKRADVADPTFATKEFLVGPWSEPSEEVYVEPDVNWFASAKHATSSNERANIEVHYWYPAMGEWITKDIFHKPGDIIGLSNGQNKSNEVIVWDPEERVQNVEEKTLVDEFNTQTIVLDLDGGRRREKLASQPISFVMPREVIAVNAHGDIIRRDSEQDDLDETRELIAQNYESMLEDIRGEMEPELEMTEEELMMLEEQMMMEEGSRLRGRNMRGRGRGSEEGSGPIDPLERLRQMRRKGGS